MSEEKIFDEIARILGRDERVDFVLVFGSAGRGESRPESDIDVAVGLVSERGLNTLDVRLDLMAALSHLAEHIDLVIVSQASPALAYRIARDGVVIFARDPRAVTRFRARAYGEYADWEYFIKPHKEALIKRIEEGKYGKKQNSKSGVKHDS